MIHSENYEGAKTQAAPVGMSYLYLGSATDLLASRPMDF